MLKEPPSTMLRVTVVLLTRETVGMDVVVEVPMVVMLVMVDTEDVDVVVNINVVVTNHAATPITAVTNITTKCATIINTMCATNTDTTSTTTTTTLAATHTVTIHVVVVVTIAVVETVETRDPSKTTATWNHMCKKGESVVLLMLVQLFYRLHCKVLSVGCVDL